MTGNEWPAPAGARTLLLLLAAVGFGYLLLQTRTPPVHPSAWRGGIPGAPGAVSPAGIVAEAVPRGGMAIATAERPVGNPLRSDRVVLTQGYGVGSHAPASVWGGVDLALDGDGDGAADPQGTMRAPIYATHDGTARVRPDTWPGGNYVAIENGSFKTAYAHLSEFAVVDGQPVVRGQVIGYVGSTGQSSGPHLHYEVWEGGVNKNPLDFGALDGE